MKRSTTELKDPESRPMSWMNFKFIAQTANKKLSDKACAKLYDEYAATFRK